VDVTLVLPLDIVTVAGTVVADELSLNETTPPPLDARALSVTVPREVVPPTTLLGFSESKLNAMADKKLTVTVAILR